MDIVSVLSLIRMADIYEYWSLGHSNFPGFRGTHGDGIAHLTGVTVNKVVYVVIYNNWAVVFLVMCSSLQFAEL